MSADTKPASEKTASQCPSDASIDSRPTRRSGADFDFEDSESAQVSGDRVSAFVKSENEYRQSNDSRNEGKILEK